MKLKKKIMSIGTAILCAANVMAYGVQSLTVNAADYSDKMTYGETYGNYLSYYKADADDDGTNDYIYISHCKQTAVSVEIPAIIDGLPVKGIGVDAFFNCSSLENITIPDSITSIGIWAFSGCSSLESITIPDSVTSIGGEAFRGTALLKNQTGVKYADTWVIGCDNDVVSAEIKDGTKGIADYTFSFGAIIPGSMPVLEVLEDGSILTKSSHLESVTIPDSVKYIGDSAFSGCSVLKSVTMGNGVTSVGTGAFSYCSSLTSVMIPDSVTSIGERAFEYCSGITSVTIPDSVKSIGMMAFGSCSSLKSVTISDSVTSIGEQAFFECPSLESISVSENNPNYFSEDGILFNKDKTTIILYPAEKADRSYIIPDSVTSIDGFAFGWCSSLESITIPNSFTSIDDRAFYECTSLKSIKIPVSVTSIGENAFSHCSSLESITIPGSVTSIGRGAFDSCSSLKSVTISDGVTSISKGAFDSCSSLKSVTIPESVTSIGEYAFFECSSLESVTILNPDCKIYDRPITNDNSYNYKGIIRGYEGSTAQAYAKRRNHSFESVNDKPLADPADTGLVDLSKIAFSIKDYVDYDNQESSVYEYFEFMIDENGNIGNGSAWKPIKAIVKMADGFELEADETRYKIEKVSKYQIKKMQEERERYNGWWASTYGTTFDGVDFDANDDYYIVNFDINNEAYITYNTPKIAQNAKLFCEEVLESGKADYAKPIISMEYSIAEPVGMLIDDYCEKEGLDSSEFSGNSFGFSLTFDSAEMAQSFEPDSIADFAENLNVSKIKENVVYFQFKKETDGKTMANVLCDLQDSEEVKKIETMPYAWLEGAGGSIGGIPKDYPLGDTNYDNEISLLDAINIAKHITGSQKLDEFQQILADYNEDGKVSLLDAIGIAEYILEGMEKK